MSYKSHKQYKDSGIEWIGKIPNSWKVLKMGRVIKVLTDYTANGSFGDLAKNVKYLDEVDYARLIRLVDLRDNLKNKGVYVSQKSYQYLKKSSLLGGEYLIANVGANAGHVCLMPNVDYPCTLAPNMMLVKFKKDVLNEFMFYASNSFYLQHQMKIKSSQSSAQPKLNKEDIRSIYIALPSIEEQKLISIFLNNKCSQIDGIILKKREQVETLKQYRQSLINQTITRGLKSNIKKIKGKVEWLAEVPEHWQIMKLKYLFSIKKIIKNDKKPTVLSLTQRGLKIKDLENNEGQHAADYSKYQEVKRNDFVMNSMDLLTGFVDCSEYEGVTSPDYRVFVQRDSTQCHRYFLYYFQMCYWNKIFYGHGQGVSNFGRWRLQTDVFKEFPVPVPPISEQYEIVEFLNEKVNEIEKVISEIGNMVDLLQKYKQSLIYEAVTGKVDVRNYDESELEVKM